MTSQIIDGRYEIQRKLGEGGMGAVYEARHLGTGRLVALKLIVTSDLARSAEVVERFHREARAAGSIETQHITSVLDTGTDPATGLPYLVMELLRGRDVAELLHDVGAVEPDAALRIIGQACAGLGRAHDAGVVHRDIKPANLFLADGESNVLVKLLDFGIAKVRGDVGGSQNKSLTRTGSMLGSPAYMSPEQAKGLKSTDHRSDLWSLGVVLYEALTGALPHADADTIGLLIVKICSEKPVPVRELAPWISPSVAAIVDRALEMDVSRRFQTAGEMLGAIEAIVSRDLRLVPAMLVGVSPERRAAAPPARAIVRSSEAAVDAGGDTVIGPPSIDTPSGAANGSARAATAAGTFDGVDREPALRPRRVRTAVVVATMIAVGAAATALVVGRRAPEASMEGLVASSHPSVTPSVTAAAAQASGPTVQAALPSEAAAHKARLQIEPARAEVLVDGKAVPVEDGSVEIVGAPGSEHEVRVRVGAQETKETVILTEKGEAKPSTVRLAVLARAPSIVAPVIERPKAVKPPPLPAKKDPGASRSFDE